MAADNDDDNLPVMLHRHSKELLDAMDTSNFLAVLKLVKANKVKYDAVDDMKNTVFHLCAIKNQPLLVGLFSAYGKGLDINAQNSSGLTAFNLAVRMRHYECAQCFVLAGCTRTNDAMSMRVFHSMVMQDSVDGLEIMMGDLNVDVKNTRGETIAHVAVEADALNVLRWISDNHKELFAVADTKGNYPIHIAAKRGSRVAFEIVSAAQPLLLDSFNKKLRSPCFHAWKHNNQEIFLHLEGEMNKTFFALDRDGQSASFYADKLKTEKKSKVISNDDDD